MGIAKLFRSDHLTTCVVVVRCRTKVQRSRFKSTLSHGRSHRTALLAQLTHNVALEKNWRREFLKES